jgi:cytoskeletal protein RodZ
MKLCPKCSREVNEIAKRCRFCGSRLDGEVPGLKPEASSSEKASETNRKAGVKIPVFFGLILVAALAVLGAVWFYGKQRALKETGSESSETSSEPASGASAEKEALPPSNTASKTLPSTLKEEPNYISVNGKVIPNPKKQGMSPSGSTTTVPAPRPAAQEEPNYISVNGQVIPNPNKKS